MSTEDHPPAGDRAQQDIVELQSAGMDAGTIPTQMSQANRYGTPTPARAFAPVRAAVRGWWERERGRPRWVGHLARAVQTAGGAAGLVTVLLAAWYLFQALLAGQPSADFDLLLRLLLVTALAGPIFGLGLIPLSWCSVGHGPAWQDMVNAAAGVGAVGAAAAVTYTAGPGYVRSAAWAVAAVTVGHTALKVQSWRHDRKPRCHTHTHGVLAHEAGHLLALWLLLPDSVVDQIELNPVDGSGRVTHRARYGGGIPQDQASAGPPTDFLADQLTVALAGNAAEKVVSPTGHAGPGSDRDLADGYVLAKAMEDGLHRRPDGSLAMLSVDHIDDAARRAEALLTEHRDLLDQVTAELAATRKSRLTRRDALAIRERVMGHAEIPDWVYAQDSRAAIRALVARTPVTTGTDASSDRTTDPHPAPERTA